MDVQVLWAELSQYHESMPGWLDPVERARRSALAQAADRQRFTLGAVLLRQLAADRLAVAGQDVEVDRRCRRCGEPHGKPRLPGGLHGSVTHSAGLVGVALTDAAPVGLDAESSARLQQWTADEALAGLVVGPGEPRPRTTDEFLRYWTRKESVVKATGDGLLTDLPAVRISGPQQPPALLSYCGARLPASMADLDPQPGYLAALTILADGGIDTRQYRLRSWRPLSFR